MWSTDFCLDLVNCGLAIGTLLYSLMDHGCHNAPPRLTSLNSFGLLDANLAQIVIFH